jgi:hypothetical protein
MAPSRRVVFISMIVVAVGTAAALGALYLDPARAAVGPLPAEGLALPGDARFVMGMDVRRVTASPLYTRYAKGSPGQAFSRDSAFHAIEEKTGVNPERDVDQLLLVGRGGSGVDAGLALVLGSFDRGKLSRAIETEKKGKVTWKDYQGTTVYLFDEGAKGTGAVAFLDDHSLLVGSQSAVETTVSNRTQGTAGLRQNTALVALLERVRPGSTFWMVGDQSLLANLPRAFPNPAGGPAGSGGSLTLPSLKSLIVTGDLDPVVAVAITGETPDEAAAKNLADMVRGLLGFLALQANQKPELREFAQAISVTTEASRVQVNARFPYALLDALQTKAPGTAWPAGPAK